VFDSKVRPFVPVKRLGGVTVYPISGLLQFLDSATSVADDLSERRAS
jgi:hypothetical protein